MEGKRIYRAAYTGDKKFIEQNYDKMKSLMDYVMARRNKNKGLNIEVNDNSYKNCKRHSGCGSCFYGLGFLGAAIYYISTANSFRSNSRGNRK